MQQIPASKGFGRLSLAVRVSLLLMLAALLPLIITISSSEFLSRPQLVAQANATMAADAQTRINAIESFFSQPVIDMGLIGQDPALLNFLGGDTSDVARQAATQVLMTGFQRNINYVNWSLIDRQGTTNLLSYPAGAALAHGRYFIAPDALKQLTIPNKVIVSSDFFNPDGDQLTVDVMEPVFANNGHLLGFLRSTLNINFIWNMVLSERGQNGAGSYAFIADSNGVIIAHSDITQNFTALAPFTASQLNDMKTLDRYGKQVVPAVLNYASLASLQQTNQQIALQMVPPGQKESFQVIGRAVPIVPWTYYVWSPTKVVTSLADQELFNVGIIGLIVLLLAAITGLIVGRRITLPVLRSVEKLQSSSQLLQELATKEQMTVTEQSWIVDASRTGLSSFNYYIDATQEAGARMLQMARGLERATNPVQVRELLNQILVAARYIENAVQYQKASSKKLSGTIDLTKQVTDQLSSSADSATHAAEQMEQVVSELQRVVGKN